MNRKLCVMTIIIMLLIVSIIGVGRWSLRFCGGNRCITVSAVTTQIDDPGLNKTEIGILRRLTGYLGLQSIQISKDMNTQAAYFNNLKMYFCMEGVDLNSEIAFRIEELIQNGEALVQLENERDFNHMSYDGQIMAEYILKQIYRLCGLELLLASDGKIEKITDLSGVVIYQGKNTKEEAGFQLDALFITLVLIQTMFCVCFAIAKKNQIFKKGGEYDGLNEKGIA